MDKGIRRYYYIEGSGDTVLPTLRFLNLGHMPLVWSNDGLYGIISAEKIANMIDRLRDVGNLPSLDRPGAGLVFHWDECQLIDPKVGKLLF